MLLPSISIRTRLVLLFILQMILIVVLGGVYLNWQLRQILEQELGNKLEGLSKTAALQIDGNLLRNILPGDEQSRTATNLLIQLNELKTASTARQIYIFNRKRQYLLETNQQNPIGSAVLFLPITQKEFDRLFSGLSVSSTLFTGNDGRLYKTGFAPILSNGQVIAALALEGSANTLEAIRSFRRDLLVLGLVLLIGSIFLGVIFSERVTTPINRLKAAALRITKGDYDSPIQTKSKDEIGFLGRTMEEMRRAIVQRDNRQKTMLAGVAHEIRNPLGGIELFAGLLVNELKDDEAKEEAQKILNEVQNLKKIVTGFLDYARPNKAHKTACAVRDVLNETRLLLADGLRNINFEFTEDPPDQKVVVDPQHLKQILLNLIKNSIEALQGVGTIHIHVEKGRRIFVSDSGPGIQDALGEKIFEPFFTNRKNGTGLGLAIVKSLVEENGGEIKLVSSASEGTTFGLFF